MAIKDKLFESLGSRVENFVQLELQRRQFGNRYTRTQQPGEPVADYQSIGLGDYQVYKPAWALIRPLENGTANTALVGSALSLYEPPPGGKPYPGTLTQGFRSPEANDINYFDHSYAGYSGISDYGNMGLRPRPGVRNIQTTLLDNGLINEITFNFKVFDKYQLNMFSNKYMIPGKEILIMFGKGYPDDNTKKLINLIHPANDDNILTYGQESLEGLVSTYSQGNMWAKIGKVNSFDVNFTGDDGSFDIRMSLLGHHSLQSYVPQTDSLKKTALYEITKRPEPPKNEKKEYDRYEKYSQFIESLRGYTTDIQYKFILPTKNSLFEIGQETESEYIEIITYERNTDEIEDEGESAGGTERVVGDEERTAVNGFERVSGKEEKKVTKIIESEESDKSLTTSDIDTIFSGNPEFNLKTINSNSNGTEQLAFGIKNDKGKGNRKIDQSYIPWSVCEWILNNGVNIVKQDGTTEVVLERFSKFRPPKTLYFIPMKIEVKEIEEELPEGSPEGTPPVKIKQTTYSDLPDKIETTKFNAHHENFIRSCQFPKIKEDIGDTTLFDLKDAQITTTTLLKKAQDEDGIDKTFNEGKLTSTIMDVETEVFSINPGVCIIADTIPVLPPVKEGVRTLGEKQFQIHELPDDFIFFSPNSDIFSKGYIRNLLINADYFFEKYENAFSPGKPDSLKTLVDGIFQDVSVALGNTVTFKTQVNTDGALQVVNKAQNQTIYSKTELETAKLDYREIEFSKVGTVEEKYTFRIYNQIFPIVNFGQDSIVREIGYNMDLDADIAGHFFWNLKSNETIELTIDSVTQMITDLQNEKQHYINYLKEDVPKEIDLKLDNLEEVLVELKAPASTYLKEYQQSAAKTYSKLVPTKGGDVDFKSVINILDTKLKKILTSTDVLGNQKVLKPNFNVPKLPLRVEVTLDGISGIKMGDSFYLSYVPPIYQNGHFIVIGIGHSIDGTDWFTKLELLYVEASFDIRQEFETEAEYKSRTGAG